MRRLFLTISLTTIALGMLAQNITVMPTDSTVTVPADRTNPLQIALLLFLLTELIQSSKVDKKLSRFFLLRI